MNHRAQQRTIYRQLGFMLSEELISLHVPGVSG